MVTVNDVEMKVNYGADILDALGASSTGLWYRVNADGTRALVREGDTFASLQGETYTSQVLLPAPKIEIDYRNESWSVTLTEEEVPEGVDVTAMDINFALSGEEYAAYANMPGLSGSWGLNLIGGIWGITFPTDKDTTLEVFYSFAVTDANGNETDVAYGERVEWVIPARPNINVDTVYPGYNEMTVTFDTEPYNVYLQSVKEPEKYFYDEDDGVVDGCIHGLTEGTEYAIIFRKLATEDSFASYPYTLKSTRTTLIRTRLSVEAAETSWSWRPGFSLTAEDCFAAQVTLQGEKELPEKGKFTLSAVNEDGAPVSFPLINAGTYTVTASLAEDVANDYRLENGSVFTVTIDPVELPAPVMTLDYDAEIIAIAELPETLPEGIEWDSVFIDIYENGVYFISIMPELSVGKYFPLSDLSYWYGETLPPAAGEEKVVLSYRLRVEGYDGNIVGQASKLVIPAHPEADAPDSDARANATTWNSIKMLDEGMLAEYDFGVAVQADALPQEPALVDEDGDGLITGLAEDTDTASTSAKRPRIVPSAPNGTQARTSGSARTGGRPSPRAWKRRNTPGRRTLSWTSGKKWSLRAWRMGQSDPSPRTTTRSPSPTKTARRSREPSPTRARTPSRWRWTATTMCSPRAGTASKSPSIRSTLPARRLSLASRSR